MKKNTVIIIFSRDRAMQLDACMQSLLGHCTDPELANIYVLYRTDSFDHEKQYKQLTEEYSSYDNISFIREENFRGDLVALLSPYDFVTFLVDDCIFNGRFSISEIVHQLNDNRDAIGFSLRYGRNISYSYTRDIEHGQPDFEQSGAGILKYNWTTAPGSFDYPLELSSSVYRIYDLFTFIVKLQFANPNDLEASMAQNSGFFSDLMPTMLCYDSSVAYCIPANIVQKVAHANRSSRIAEYSVKAMMDKFAEGFRIDWKALSVGVNATHVEKKFSFIKKDIVSDAEVSVIVPCYNQGEFLDDALSSVIAQTYTNWECIIINDGSTDNSAEIAKSLIEKYSEYNISLIEQENNGLPAARNAAITQSNGKYLLPLDADDMLHQDYLSETVRILDNNPDYYYVYTDEQNFGESDHVHKKGPVSLQNLIYSNIHDYCCLMRRELWEKTGGYSPGMFIGAADWNIWITAAKLELKAYHLQKPLFLYRGRPGTMVSGTLEKINEVRAHIVLHHPEMFNEAAIDMAEDIIRKMPQDSLDKYYSALEKNPDDTILQKIKTLLNRDIAPLVSVIIPTYNRPEMLRDAIESVLSQKFTDYEIIVVNDAGEDVSNLIASYAGQNIKYISHTENKGLSAARNTGIKASNSKYIAYLDDDDIYYPDHLETLVLFLENNNYQVAYTDAYRARYKSFDGKLALSEKDVPYSEDFDYDKILISNYIPVLCFMHERTCAIKSGYFDESLSSHEDWDLWIRMSRIYKFAHIKSITCEFSVRDDNSSLTDDKRNMLDTIKKVHEKSAHLIGDNTEVIQGRKEFVDWMSYEAGVLFDGFNSEETVISTASLERETSETDFNVSIVIVAHNNFDNIKECLESVFSNTKNSLDYEVLIFDNGSTDEGRDYLESAEILYPQLRVLTNPVKLSKPAAYNKAMLSCNSNYIVLLNEHVRPQSKWLASMLDVFTHDKSVGVCGPRIIYPFDNIVEHCGINIGIYEDSLTAYNINKFRSAKNIEAIDDIRKVQAVSSMCMMISSELIADGIMFDEEYTAGHEDSDFCLQCGMQGYKVIYNGQSLTHIFEYQLRDRDYRETSVNVLARKWQSMIKPDEAPEQTRINLWEVWAREELLVNPRDKAHLSIILQIARQRQDFEEVEYIENLLAELESSTTESLGNRDKMLPSSSEPIAEPETQALEIDINEEQTEAEVAPEPEAQSVEQESKWEPEIFDKPEENPAEIEFNYPYEFSIIIPVHNKHDVTKNCLSGISKTLGMTALEIIIIDNGSVEETKELLNSLPDWVKLITNDKNKIYAYANNQGAAAAEGEYLIFLNNDTYPFPGWLEALRKEFEENPNTAAQGAKLLYENGSIQHAGMVFGARPGQPEAPYHAYLTADPTSPQVNHRRKVQFVTGACLVVRNDVFRNIGGFDEDYIFGWEDTDLCMKINSQGLDIIYNPEVTLYHYESTTKKLLVDSGAFDMSPEAPHEQANRQRFMARWNDKVKRDAYDFYNEDGFRLEGYTLKNINEVEKPVVTDNENTENKKPVRPTSGITSFAARFWRRNYKSATIVLIKCPSAIGDTLTITAIVKNLKTINPDMRIHISGHQIVHDIFKYNDDIEKLLEPGSDEEFNVEAWADEIIDYNDVMAYLPEYFNCLPYMDIMGNLAGIKFTDRVINYIFDQEELDDADKMLNDYGLDRNLLALHMHTNKDIQRSYPKVKKLINELLELNPDYSILLLGSEINDISNERVLNCGPMDISFRTQMALASFAEAFLTVDSAFFHAGHNLFFKPTVVVTGVTNPNLIGNPATGFHYITNETLKCLNCYWLKPCRIECMNELAPDMIARKFHEFFRNIEK